MDASVANMPSNQERLDSPPPQPPKGGKKSLMSMAAGPASDAGLDQMSPAIQAMKAMGEARQSLLKLSTLLPPLAQGIQQVIQGLEQVVPQMVADVVAGNPPGSGGSGMGAPQASASPTAPPVSTGMP